MEMIIAALIIIAFMVAVIGIRQDILIREQRKFINWFYRNINFVEEDEDDLK